jgi:hypothetical protein
MKSDRYTVQSFNADGIICGFVDVASKTTAKTSTTTAG